ncbi:MAG: M48 family metallopeptidase [Burkholderiaceae bacterium]|nr:MAG: M48 family metallopeptidase [Burkholderiaceae bacterium]
MDLLAATYYDGITSRRMPVRLSLAADGLHVLDLPSQKVVALTDIRWPEVHRHGPRLLRFADNSYCEIAGGSDFDAWCARHQISPDGGINALMQRWNTVLLCTALLIVMLFAGYRWGLPALSEWLAYRLPADTLLRTEQDTLKFLDGQLLQPSQVPAARQQALREGLAQMRLPAGIEVHYTLEFRASERLGANAFALPAGTIVVTDELVQMTDNDAQVLAVLSHEIGHLYRRHALRGMIQSTVVGAVTAWFLGDVSSILAGVPAMLLDLRYSRGFESEADAFAVHMLQANQQSSRLLAQMLEKLERAADQKQRNNAQQKNPEKKSDVWDYFSTHPDTAARIRALNQYADQQP